MQVSWFFYVLFYTLCSSVPLLGRICMVATFFSMRGVSFLLKDFLKSVLFYSRLLSNFVTLLN